MLTWAPRPEEAQQTCPHQVGKEKTLPVKIIRIHPLERPEGEAAEKKLDGNCDSPSSDKENASQEVQSKMPSSREESRREMPSEWTGPGHLRVSSV